MPIGIELKKTLIKYCHNYVDDRVRTCEEAIKQAQRSANEETKSSSGDKYETGRAMAQLEIEKQLAQLHEAKSLRQQLNQIAINQASDFIQVGSLVITNRGNYFISVAAGKVSINQEDFYTVSVASPIGKLLIGLRRQSTFQFNKGKVEVIDFI
jgi:transcription elongation GreA/GreB family factor